VINVFLQKNKYLRLRFLLAKFYLDALKGKMSPKAIRKALEMLPTGFQEYDKAYDKAYEDAMERIGDQLHDEKQLAIQVLYWITCAKRPLTTSELEHALAVERDSSQFDDDNICLVEDMVSVCAGLVTIDEEVGIIRLVHYTTQQYLKRTQERWFPQIETDIAAICCTYLSFETFEQFEGGEWPSYNWIQRDQWVGKATRVEKAYAFYSYASYNWALHACKASILIPGVIRFLEKNIQVRIATVSALKDVTYRKGIGGRGIINPPLDLTGLHLAAYHGFDKAVEILITKQEIDAKDSHGQTPFSYAAENGHEAVVRLLLATGGVEINSKASLNETPLYFAAGAGQEAIVRLLLGLKDINPDARDAHGITVLALAANNGHAGIVKLLLDTGRVNPNSLNGKMGVVRTPLSYAAGHGHVEVVKVLLAKLAQDGIDPDTPNDERYTPLHVALRSGHEEVVKLLLAQEEVDVNRVTHHGRCTPLVTAAENGNEAIVKLLLAHTGIAMVLIDGRWSPVVRAYGHGHKTIVDILLAWEDTDVDAEERGNNRALTEAARCGHMELVHRLLTKKGVDINATDYDGMSALSYAAKLQHTEMLKFLVEQKGIRLLKS
jgi:ankyrin repeat protein